MAGKKKKRRKAAAAEAEAAKAAAEAEAAKAAAEAEAAARPPAPASRKTEIIFAGREFEKAWNTYGAALGRWAESAAHMQKTAAEMMLSWFDVCQKTAELDRRLLKRAKLRWEEASQEDTPGDDDSRHDRIRRQAATGTGASLGPASSPAATVTYAAAFIKAQSELLREFNRQWERLWQPRPQTDV